MAVTEFEGIEAVRAAVGTHLGFSDWVTVTKEQVEAFADATGDRLLIHDDESQATETPNGGPVAPAYLLLSLTNFFLPQLVEVGNVSLGVNRGTGEIRFPARAPAGSRLRAGAELAAVDDVPGGIDTTMVITVEAEGADQPVCAVESLTRYLA